MIQQPRVRTKTYGETRFDKTASTLWNNLLLKVALNTIKQTIIMAILILTATQQVTSLEQTTDWLLPP